MNPYRTNRVTVDLSAIAANTEVLRAHVPKEAALMAVVKADAYGHGALQVARTALAHGANALGVAIPEEGALLREAGIGAEILVLGGVERAGAKAAVAYGLTQTVFDAQTVSWLSQEALRTGRQVRVHIKLDTGMGRIGVRSLEALVSLMQAIEDAPGVRLTGAFTHFAAADAEDEDFLTRQAERFDAFAAVLRTHNPLLVLHTANSAALLRHPALAHGMVRAGIVLYGAPPVATDLPLRQAMRWHTVAVAVKDLPAGEPVSYGCTYVTPRPSRIMTLPVGYGDGYRRALSGRAEVLVRGLRAPVVGRVCMDQTMVDVTHIPGASAGDEAVLMGCQGEDCITAGEMAAWADTISYEMFLSPSRRVPRIYIR